ncbi:hypothetical protein [Chryseobacterium indologenes]|uniref:hypothetical protein n=1 Tax=Chryseobacterium indologenes TaxID=253 RepID=UPI00301A6532
MRSLLLFLIFSSIFSSSQVIKDSILGKPKFVKENVIFLDNSGPYTFMKGDDEYGHATKMTPENLRKSMEDSWFETYFCRYTNNETYYNRNQKIVKEIWYYRSGDTVDLYNYQYDHLNRLTIKKSQNRYSDIASHYFYEKDNKTPKFAESYYKRKNVIEKFTFNYESYEPLFVTEFDSITKTDSIFAITNDIWKKVGERSYTEGKDSIYHKKLSRVKIYNNDFKIIEEKFFDYKSDYQNKKISLNGHYKYEYDEFRNLVKQTGFKNGKISSSVVFENGKKVREEDINDNGTTQSTVYIYTKDQKLERQTMYYNDKIIFERSFKYKGNYITNMTYLNKIGMEDKNIVPKLITFKYKFDKQKNWIETIKNVDGKDLYKWVREIEYY